jgi:hypothetical protein
MTEIWLIILTATALCSCSDAVKDNKYEFRGLHSSRNEFLIKGSLYRFGDKESEEISFHPIKRFDRQCVDAGVIAFALDRTAHTCGDFSFTFVTIDDGAVLVTGKCERTSPDGCTAPPYPRTLLQYRLRPHELPESFSFEVGQITDERFSRLRR